MRAPSQWAARAANPEREVRRQMTEGRAPDIDHAGGFNMFQKQSVFHTATEGATNALPGAALALCLLASLGCSAESLDLGDPQLAVDRSALSSYAAVWEGYTEAFHFHSGSDRIRIALSTDATGALRFGQGEPAPVSTDPDNPLQGWLDELGQPLSEHDRQPAQLLEGFSYAVTGANVEEERIQLRARGGQQFDGACALQTPFEVPESPGNYLCVPGSSGSSANGECWLADGQTPVACGKLNLCLSPACSCDSSGCKGRLGDDIELDAALDDTGTRLEGTLLSPGGNATVRLTRME
jgi:hypothetical protein